MGVAMKSEAGRDTIFHYFTAVSAELLKDHYYLLIIDFLL